MKAFVTGGSGFIGRHLITKLRERGYDVVALARSQASQRAVAKLGATPVAGDILHIEAAREAMAGSDVVFHMAGWYRVGAPDNHQAEAINVRGTRKVLRLAHQLGIPRIIYTSTLAVFDDTHGQMVDESYEHAGPFLLEYNRTKWLAHFQVAVPLIESGAPITIVMPGAVYGPGDHSWVADMMRLFYQGRLPAVPAPESTVTYLHVEDAADAHILALEKGQPGETYIMSGPAVPLGEMIDFWAHLTGRRAPTLRVPAALIKPLAPLAEVANALLPMPSLFHPEMVRNSGATYTGRSDKARRELGWQPRPLQSGMLETFDWIAATTPPPAPLLDEEKRRVAAFALLGAAALFLLWFLTGRRRD